jgi:hypothetical protein
MFDPRDDARDRDGREDGRARVYDERDRDDDPREGLMRDLDLPRGEERELVAVRDRVYELDSEDTARWPPSAPSGSCPNTISTSTTTRSTTCATRVSSRRWTWATTNAA